MSIFVDVDPFAPHREECGFWDGGSCDCHPEAKAALERDHCHECDFVNAQFAWCNCRGRCICEREDGCPCVERGLAPAAEAVS